MMVMDEQQEEQHRHENRHRSKASSSSFSTQSMVTEREKKFEAITMEKEEKAKVAKSLPPFLGRHRMSAAISQLNIQITIIQEELNELETVGESSIVCKDVISNMETIPDPLLPISNGPIDVNWDRWFRGAHNSKSNKRWI